MTEKIRQAFNDFSDLKKHALFITSLLLQKYTVLRQDENFLVKIIGDADIKHSDVIKYAMELSVFEDVKEYFHFKNEVFYVDSLLTNVELDVALNIVLKTNLPYTSISRDKLIEQIIKHPIVYKERNKDVPFILKMTIPKREKAFINYLDNLTEVDFQNEIIIAANQIIRETNLLDTEFYTLKATIIYNYVVDYLQDTSVLKLIEKDISNITRYLLANTSTIMMESLTYRHEDSLGVFSVGNKNDDVLGFTIGLDEEDSIVKEQPKNKVEVFTSASTAIDDLDKLLESLNKD